MAVPTLIGVWVDRKWSCEPWGFLTGFCLGMAGGLYRFISASMAAMRSAGEDDRQENDDRKG